MYVLNYILPFLQFNTCIKYIQYKFLNTLLYIHILNLYIIYIIYIIYIHILNLYIIYIIYIIYIHIYIYISYISVTRLTLIIDSGYITLGGTNVISVDGRMTEWCTCTKTRVLHGHCLLVSIVCWYNVGRLPRDQYAVPGVCLGCARGFNGRKRDPLKPEGMHVNSIY